MVITSGGKWEDEEEKRFFEDIQDLKDFVPKSVLGLDESEGDGTDDMAKEADKEEVEETERLEKAKVKEEVRKLEEELEGLKLAENRNGNANGQSVVPATVSDVEDAKEEVDECVAHAYACSFY